MSEVQQVIVQIKPPRGNFPGMVVYGYYTLIDGVVTMTDAKGEPAEDGIGKRYTHKLMPNEDAKGVACRMTRKLRLALRGDGPASVSGFDAPLKYPKMGIC
jgi:hypothetical protein